MHKCQTSVSIRRCGENWNNTVLDSRRMAPLGTNWQVWRRASSPISWSSVELRRIRGEAGTLATLALAARLLRPGSGCRARASNNLLAALPKSVIEGGPYFEEEGNSSKGGKLFEGRGKSSKGGRSLRVLASNRPASLRAPGGGRIPRFGTMRLWRHRMRCLPIQMGQGANGKDVPRCYSNASCSVKRCSVSDLSSVDGAASS